MFALISTGLFMALFSISPAKAANVTHPDFRDTSYQAKFVSQSIPDPVVIEAGTTKEVTVKIKNTGSATWKKDGTNFVSIYTFDPRYHPSVFAGKLWKSKDKPIQVAKTVAPGEVAEFSITLYAPAKPGEYTERFYLAAENKTWIKGGYFYFIIKVVEPVTISSVQKEVPTPIVSPVVADSATTSLPLTPTTPPDCVFDECAPVTPVRELIPEPTIRVGLYKTTEEIRFQSEFPYQVYAGEELQGELPPGTLAQLNYHEGTYSFSSMELTFDSKNYLRLVPSDSKHYFQILNYQRKLSGRGQMSFNIYRGTMEYKFSPKSAMPYIINELPLDLYVRGVTEISDGASIEYLKALSVAARSYANSRIDTTTPKDKRTFDVYPTTADQLYLGYLSEVTMPRYASAVQATAGQMVTYKTKPVVTYYFSHSDGKTRAGKQPWLQSVEAKHDKGLKMLGHGIGMSGRDAMLRASKDGWNYEQILKHYYTGVEVERVY